MHRILLLLLALPCLLGAQESRPLDPGAATITTQRVKDAISFLASDELMGRDSPSPGLEQAAAYLAARFTKAGLVPPGQGKDLFHRYTLEGLRLDPAALEVAVHAADGTVTKLEPGRDVRYLRASGAFASEAGEVESLTLDEFLGQRRQRGAVRARKPILVQVPADSLFWKNAEAAKDVLGRGGRGEAPILLVRAGVLPEGAIRAAVRIPEPATVSIALTNVVGVLPGTTRQDEIVLVSAHYDHVGVQAPVNGDAIYNGADDDATGTTAVLRLAEAFSQRKERLPRTLAFVCFSAEEKGLRGSRAFAGAPPFPLAQVAVNLNLEMLGRPEAGKERKAWVTGRKLSDFESILQPALARAGVDVLEFPMERMLFSASDNYSFASKGVVAHSISAGTLHADYHQPGDEVDKLDLEHMTAVISGIYEGVVEFATRAEKPAYNEQGKKAIAGR